MCLTLLSFTGKLATPVVEVPKNRMFAFIVLSLTILFYSHKNDVLTLSNPFALASSVAIRPPILKVLRLCYCDFHLWFIRNLIASAISASIAQALGVTIATPQRSSTAHVSTSVMPPPIRTSAIRTKVFSSTASLTSLRSSTPVSLIPFFLCFFFKSAWLLLGFLLALSIFLFPW